MNERVLALLMSARDLALRVPAALDRANERANLEYDALSPRATYVWTVGGAALALLLIHAGGALLATLGVLGLLVALVGRGWVLFRPVSTEPEIEVLEEVVEEVEPDHDGG